MKNEEKSNVIDLAARRATRPTQPTDEQKVVAQGRCVWQIWSGVQQKARGREIAGHLGWTGYCGDKATHGPYCAEHAAAVDSSARPVRAVKDEAYALFLRGCQLDEDEATLDEAARCYEEAIRLDPKLEHAYVNLGNCMYRRGRAKLAVALYGQAVAINGTCGLAHYNLGYVAMDAGDYDGAVPHFARALRVDPRHADAHFDVALCYEKTERRALAAPHWRSYLALKRRPKKGEEKYVEIARKYLEGGS